MALSVRTLRRGQADPATYKNLAAARGPGRQFAKPDGTVVANVVGTESDWVALARDVLGPLGYEITKTPDPTPTPTPDPTPTPTPTGPAGVIRAFRELRSDMDQYLLAAVAGDAAKRAWLQKFERLHVWMNGSSYPADKALAQSPRWMPRSWVYRDCMVASYITGSAPARHYLRDQAGNRLFVNYGKFDQLCADVTSPVYRASYVAGVRSVAALAGGNFMDDCNLEMSRVVSDGAGRQVQPYHWEYGADGLPVRPLAQVLQSEWQAGMATFAEEIDAALAAPAELVANVVYFHAGGLANADVRRALTAADVWEFERGFGDGGIRPGTGQFGFETVLGFIDFCHSVGTAVCHHVQAKVFAGTTQPTRDYVRGCYLLTTDGHDFLGHPDMSPSVAWWSEWDRDLGAALEFRRKLADGTFERRFERGTVRVDPSARTSTVT